VNELWRTGTSPYVSLHRPGRIEPHLGAGCPGVHERVRARQYGARLL